VKKYTVILLLILLFSCHAKRDTVPFNDFEQLSAFQHKSPGFSIKEKPVLLKTVAEKFFLQIDTSLNYKSWLLNKEYNIIHKTPSFELRLTTSTTDSLFILNCGFSLDNLLMTHDVTPLIQEIKLINEAGRKYIILKVIDITTGRHLSCYLLVFYIQNPKKVISLNENSKMNGQTWDVENGLITDINSDGKVELQLLDTANASFNSYVLDSIYLKKTPYRVFFKQQGNDCLYIDLMKSNWPCDIPSFKKNDSCDFNFYHYIEYPSYD